MSKFYYKGTVYPNEEEFIRGVHFFNESPVNEESVSILLRQFEANIKANLFLNSIEERTTNQQFNIILEQALDFILMKAFDMRDKKNENSE